MQMSIGSVCQCRLLKLISRSCWLVVVVDVTHRYSVDALHWHGDNTSRRCRWQNRTPRTRAVCHVAVCSRNSAVRRVTCVRETPASSAAWTPSHIGCIGMDVLLHSTHQLLLIIRTTRLGSVRDDSGPKFFKPKIQILFFFPWPPPPVFKALLSH